MLEDLESFLTEWRANGLRADIFTFAEKLPTAAPRQHCYFEWDNWAVVPIRSFSAWWTDLPQESRKNVRRAAKRGVTVTTATYDDQFVRGIQAIYNETPVRQGRNFWHYGKTFDAVKSENGTYLDRSDFLAAYANNELIGFAKLVYVDKTATLLQILAKNEHHDKRPTNALVAAAVQLCERRGIAFLIYGKYVYGNHTSSPLTEFKRRNGFLEVRVPRYYVALSPLGRFAIKCRLHAGLRHALPPKLISVALRLRSRLYSHIHQRAGVAQW